MARACQSLPRAWRSVGLFQAIFIHRSSTLSVFSPEIMVVVPAYCACDLGLIPPVWAVNETFGRDVDYRPKKVRRPV